MYSRSGFAQDILKLPVSLPEPIIDVCIFSCLGCVIHCPCNIAPPNLEEQIKLIRGKKTSVTAPGLVMSCTYQEWYLSGWVCLKAPVSRTHVAIIMSYVGRNVSGENCIDCFLIYVFVSPSVPETKITAEMTFVEMTFDSITRVRPQKTGEQLCSDVQRALIQLSQRHTHTHPFRWLQQVQEVHWTLSRAADYSLAQRGVDHKALMSDICSLILSNSLKLMSIWFGFVVCDTDLERGRDLRVYGHIQPLGGSVALSMTKKEFSLKKIQTFVSDINNLYHFYFISHHGTHIYVKLKCADGWLSGARCEQVCK